VAIQITPELVTSVAGLVAAIGVAFKNVRDTRRERRARRKELEQVARAAAAGPEKVAAAVEDMEKTGTFTRPTGLDADR
jgi:hypothetical protein